MILKPPGYPLSVISHTIGLGYCNYNTTLSFELPLNLDTDDMSKFKQMIDFSYKGEIVAEKVTKEYINGMVRVTCNLKEAEEI